MRFIAAFLFVALLPSTALSEQPATLRDHMRAMGYLLDEVFALSKETGSLVTAADKTRELRGHLVQSIAIFPGKFSAMRETERNSAAIEYHQLFARVIYLSATLERTLLAGQDFPFESGSKNEDVRNLLYEINVLVGQAHRKFRD